VKTNARGAMIGWGAAGLVLWGLASSVAAGPARVLAVRSKDLPAYNEAVEGFRRTISGRIPGATVESVTLPDDPAAARSLLDNISRNPPDIVLAVGGPAARQAREAIRSAPVIFCMAMAEEADFTYGGALVDLPLAEYLNQIRRDLPGVKNIGFIYNPSSSSIIVRQAQALEAKGALIAFPANSPADVDRIIFSFRQKADCLLLWPDPTLFPANALSFFLKDTFDKNIPVVGVSPFFVKAGAVAAFFPDYGHNGEMAAAMALKVLAGQPIEKLPVQTPSKVRAGFNLSIARHLNVALNDDAVASAADVVR